MFERYSGFLKNQLRQLREGGVPVLSRKVITFVLVILALPFVLVVRILRPVVCIRFGPLSSQRIGTFAGYTDMYLCHRAAGNLPGRILDIFYLRHPVSNRQLARMLGRRIRILAFARWVDFLNRYVQMN